jgi:predicted dehydrogenase
MDQGRGRSRRPTAFRNRPPTSTPFVECDAVIIASPSDRHFEQALAQSMPAGIAWWSCRLLVGFEAREPLRAATDANVVLQCAHTMRVLPGMVR